MFGFSSLRLYIPSFRELPGKPVCSEDREYSEIQRILQILRNSTKLSRHTCSIPGMSAIFAHVWVFSRINSSKRDKDARLKKWNSLSLYGPERKKVIMKNSILTIPLIFSRKILKERLEYLNWQRETIWFKSPQAFFTASKTSPNFHILCSRDLKRTYLSWSNCTCSNITISQQKKTKLRTSLQSTRKLKLPLKKYINSTKELTS